MEAAYWVQLVNISNWLYNRSHFCVFDKISSPTKYSQTAEGLKKLPVEIDRWNESGTSTLQPQCLSQVACPR
uniref:Uncharacterized protein n=1 Tax=Anguilla anguilla TaxID=7936 RepID=A0A0E9S2V5_ANGAN